MQTMRRISAPLAASLIWIPLSVGVSAYAQTTEQAPVQGTQVLAPVVPQQVRFTGQLTTRSGDTVEAVFSIYAAPEGGDPLWTETQQVAIDAEGSYTVLLGSASPAGLPQTLFAGGAARWLGVSVERAPELTRVLLSSVPYAMKSADAQALSGHPAGDFVTQGQLSEQLSQFAQTESHAQSPDLNPLTSGTVTGSGTSGRIPIWTGTLTQGSSVMYGVGSDIGIGSSAPAATLDVNGTGIFRGSLTMPPLNTATTSTGQASQLTEWQSSAWSTTAAAAVTPTYRIFMSPVGNDTATPSGSLEFNYQLGTTSTTVMQLASNGSLITGGIQMLKPYVASTSGPVSSPVFEFSGSSYSSTSSSAVAQNYELEVVPTGNNTSSPSSYLALLYGSGTTTPAQTGLTISTKGVIGWAPGQTFPITGTGGGTITGITTSSPLTGSGTSGSVALGLNQSALVTDITPSLESTFNGVYPQLGAANTFTTNQTISGAVYGNMLTVSQDASSGSWAVYATNGAEYGNAVYAAGGADGIGVQSDGAQTAGSEGILGDAPNGSGNSNSYYALYDDWAVGIWADAADGASLALVATADDLTAAYFYNDSSGDATLDLYNDGGGPADVPRGISTVLRAEGKGGICGINQTGNLSCTGQVKSVVSTENGTRQTETYAVQSAENWIEDYGSGQLSAGSATVMIETAFAETVNTGVEFHVFLTPGGDCKGLYVTNKTANSFEVHELGGGTSSIPFDYKIVAKRRGFETQRLVDVTERMRVETEAAKMKQLAQPLPRTRRTMPAMSAGKHGATTQ